eukprot:g12574.t1
MNTVLKLAFKPVNYILNWPDKYNEFLQGAYAPVQEEVTAQECEVVGEVPEAVFGEFARNGPNPRLPPTGRYHWFDGDGMVHAVRLKSSDSAMYTNRYTKTNMLKATEQTGEPVGIKFGDLASRLVIPKMMIYNLKAKLGVTPNFSGMHESTANTSLVYHAGRLLALSEGGLPYALRVMCEGVIETIGKLSFEGKMDTAFTAHPKLHVSSGKLYGFGYSLESKPYVTMYVVDAEGKLERQFPINVERGTIMHDFAITEKYAIFLDLPLVMKPENFSKGKFPIVYDDKLYARMGVLPLDATDDSSIRWFDMPEAFFAFHVLNAWEEEVEVEGEGNTNRVLKIVTCDLFEFDLDPNELINQKEQPPGRLPQPHTTTLNLDTGKATRACIIPQPPKEGLDFPQLRKTLVGKKNRFGFFAGFDLKGLPTALVKLDLQAATPETTEVGRIDLGDWLGGESIFVPRHGGEEEEDDGYLVGYVSPKDCSGNSELRVWDAKTMNADPVATIKLPARVPLGFHAIFMGEADLAAQKPAQ